MAADRPILTLAHSGDPDDAFMWWPLTGKVRPDGSPVPGEGPRLISPRFAFRAVPGDIAEFNRLAAGSAPYDITALSVRAYADVADRYVITAVGSSFGEGYGPKVVSREGGRISLPRDLCSPGVRLAVPGLRTSAVLTLTLMLRELGPSTPALIERRFDEIIPAVVRGEADAGLVIHEGQVMFRDAGLREVIDLGEWWGRTRGLPLPLGINAVKRDLDARFGPGSLVEVAGLLGQSLSFALAHRDESVEYTLDYAAVNARASGLHAPTRATVERYLGMYVTSLTADMGDAGRAAIERLLAEGAKAGLCPSVPKIDVLERP
ncbi:MAG: 1,4-dihydroxy-6-naphtoate synthase [Phycisphaerae bacterium]|nr:MAG: 1,4-dihydroxy-6-naphtoate synthase [Phycisphaerae bacterium]